MKKSLQRKTTYEPNQGVKVTVVNKPLIDQNTGEHVGYQATATIKIKMPVISDELKFADTDELSDFIGTIDFDESQQSLLKN